MADSKDQIVITIDQPAQSVSIRIPAQNRQRLLEELSDAEGEEDLVITFIADSDLIRIVEAGRDG